MKRILSLLLALIMVFTFAGCTGKTSETTTEEKTETTETIEVAEGFTGNYVVSPSYVKDNLNNENVIFVDARGEDAAKKGTVPNAIVMTWQQIADVEGKKPGDEGWGHMLEKGLLAERLGALGLDKNKEIVLFAEGKNGWGDNGRILWELKAAGYKNLKMVDGDFSKIKDTGIEITTDITPHEPVEVVIDEMDYKNTINTKELTESFDNYLVIDSREKDEYDGATKYGEAKGGHLPKSINIPYTSMFDENGMLISNEKMEALFKDAGLNKDDEIVTYCTGGIRSAYMQLIMEELGYNNVKNYEGSYYNWAAINEVE
ncbi:MAG: sulfurtransferase [Tissierellia bacterium]|nr:sulfurtransferase [Tissierellia bacterium]